MQGRLSTEEAILRKNKCPDLDEHSQEHDKLYQLLLEQLNAGMYLRRFNKSAFDSLMTCWLSHHLFEVDMPDKAYLQER